MITWMFRTTVRVAERVARAAARLENAANDRYFRRALRAEGYDYDELKRKAATR